jgi:hypothetical protein
MAPEHRLWPSSLFVAELACASACPGGHPMAILASPWLRNMAFDESLQRR